VIFSELSPRPHDTGMVTLISQHLSEFALHVRALLGLPIPEIRFYGPSASRALLAEGNSTDIAFTGIEKALAIPGTDMRVFGKPEVKGHRRMGVMLATGSTVKEACDKAERAAAEIHIDCK
jgi:phosphoribosylglycinamide formyltransferase 2